MKHTTEQHMIDCACRSAGECDHNGFAWAKALDACVDDFAWAMKQKLKKKFIEGKDGWDDPNWPIENVLDQLRAHIDKGDMVDVANFAMFAWNKAANAEITGSALLRSPG